MTTRRSFLYASIKTLAAISVLPLSGCNGSRSDTSNINVSLIDKIGPLLSPDANGVMLPSGFTSRIIARTGEAPYAGSSFLWHSAPDGGAVFSTTDGGWIYVSNSEVNGGLGSVSALRFDSNANITQAYSILDNTSRNCAGGATPWGTWLSCEEYNSGNVWECDPFGINLPSRKTALGTFSHEAVAYDTTNNILYLTEDKPDGGFYRFVPDSFRLDGYPDFSSGTLGIAVVDSLLQSISWVTIPDPGAAVQNTRDQVATKTSFNGGEGIVYFNNLVSFTTKGDDKVWSYNTMTNTLSTTYDASVYASPVLTGVDNITVSKEGELIVAEDGGNLQIVAITKANNLIPLMQLVGHDSSEIAGPAFAPDGTRLYFSSQRGTAGVASAGITFEVTGPFHRQS